ncbi:kinetochore complex Sim4 subunit Fta1-domain-containing protein [Xylaria nigripes]|nr:kinetochore complex Sim4 subunit Fta1-domain-containing protein [Xylaria nigripes]
MPPRKRGRPAAIKPPQNEPEPAASDDNASNHTGRTEDSHSDSGEGERSDFRFFNTTFSTFRVSPLYVGQQPLTTPGLETLSRRLRDTLVGDVVRGVQVGLESDATLGRAGALIRVEWRKCSMEMILPTLAGLVRDEATHRGRGGRSRSPQHLLCLELEYENVTFSALLLPSIDSGDGDNDNDELKRLRNPPSWTSNNTNRINKGKGRDGDKDEGDSAFAHYPLLLTRLPVPLKVVLADFLSSIFDCRISPLHLGTRTLIHSWERCLQEIGPAATPAKKDIAITLAFDLDLPNSANHDHQPSPTPQLGLKTLDVIVPAAEIHRFLRAGEKQSNQNRSTQKRLADPTATTTHLKKKRAANSKDEEGWTWRETEVPYSDSSPTPTIPQPFTDALARYLDHTLALDIFHPAVRVQRVVCDAFALSDGRVKIFAPTSSTATSTSAVETFVRDLVSRAEGRAWSPGALRLAEIANVT